MAVIRLNGLVRFEASPCGCQAASGPQGVWALVWALNGSRTEIADQSVLACHDYTHDYTQGLTIQLDFFESRCD